MGILRKYNPSARFSTVFIHFMMFQSGSETSHRLISSNISAVSKNLLGFHSGSPTPNRLSSSDISAVWKNLLGLDSSSPTPNRLISSKISVVSKNLMGFQSGSPISHRFTSSTTLRCVKISNGPKILLGLGFDQKFHNPLGPFVGTRHYSVPVLDKYIYQPLIKCLGCVTFFTGRFETVPFINRRLYVFPFLDKIWGELYFRSVKEGFRRGLVLPQSHPQCVRIESIAIKILEALQRETCRRHKLADRKWLRGDDGEVEVVKEKRKENVKLTAAYLDEGIDWEFFVPDEPIVNAAYINIGKILVFRGLFDLYKTDEELAITIATEVAHVVCRQAQRRLTWLPFKLYHRFINHYTPEIYYQLRHDHEGDFIGMLLSASAGYDPRVAPMALAKMKRDDAHMLFGDERIAYMAHPEVMQQAVSIYEAKKKELGTDHQHKRDYFGTLLSASAGYDPRVAPIALKKMKRDVAPFFFMEERIVFIAQQEAVSMYQERKLEQGID